MVRVAAQPGGRGESALKLLREFLTWWAERMAEFVPAWLSGDAADIADALLVEPVPGTTEFDLIARQGGVERPLGRAMPGTALDDLLRGNRPPTTLVRLPAAMLLEREVALPLAAAADLDRVVAYEMDRLTPFAAADVYWSASTVRQDADRNRIWVRLSLVPRSGLRRLVEALRQAGREPTGLRIVAGDGTVRRISMVADAPGTTGRARRASRAAAMACGVLALIAAGLPIARPWWRLSAVEARIAALAPAIAEVEALRRQIVSRTGGADILAAESARLGSAVRAIATLTQALPDGTHLTAMTMRQRQITLGGQSDNAARLIPLLSAEPALREVSFLSPVTRAEPSRAEIFSIKLELGS